MLDQRAALGSWRQKIVPVLLPRPTSHFDQHWLANISLYSASSPYPATLLP